MIKATKPKKESRGKKKHYLLGLDLGPASVGWAIVGCTKAGKPNSLIDCGVRRFAAGVEGSNENIAAGRDEPRALARRTARSLRRSTWRRRRRMRKLYLILAHNGMLPKCEDSAEGRHNAILQLDVALRDEYLLGDSHPDQHCFPYALRCHALDGEMSPLALGRAIYHLAQRRGYRSNRKTETSDEERGAVATGISSLEQAIESTGSRTLGEYFSTLDPEEERIRGRWTGREMFQHEFAMIWAKQAALQPKLCTDELRDQLQEAIFHQRPLKSQKRWGDFESEIRRATIVD